ncbi:hypothetical protein [Marinobacter salarius]|uniref:Uncharacterized protein n=1 Tax=Marinobacter salarius TaxID=1420917 RepID=A0A1W6KFL0_9GAMM|nr:hypothetical protein [Marinobacter salarius]ARM86206.1 hypothetical protein MARSALSMR5_04186 [Marinobacter salarius]
MPAKRPSEAAEDSLAAGITSSFAMTDIGKSLGANTPEKVGAMAQRLTAGTGWDQVRNTHGLIFGTLVAIAIVAGVIYAFRGTPTAGILGLLGLIVGGFLLLSIAISVGLQMTAYVPVRLRARLYSVAEPKTHAGTQITSHPMIELLCVIPFKVAALLIITPFWLVGSMLEVLRVTLLGLFSKHTSYRGDQGKYYDRVRKHYAKVYVDEGLAAAQDYLRIAYSGLLTPIGVEIPREAWTGEAYKEWLAPMIRRHGPVTKYAKGAAGTPTGVLRAMSNQGTDKVKAKYDAI